MLYALLAGLMWGLIFVGPLLVPEYPAMLQSMGRYLALGLIALPLAWPGAVERDIKARVGERLESVGLSHKADAWPAQLSGGQRQR
ncbi:hypothetical protein K4G90_23000, partial [Mycobacterium tuberculosis]|nr:hypothetical protein [Mycobacterium tuberculosis]